ncbi:glucohydrolase [Salinigranum rubrum]|uniref:Glucohydrolase n=1 Tax=Salinigranum rubrum TaxID=755307 RepID=A0A2I8VFS0_9EURY|nr:alpha-glucosidase [Salinigranum rubrum]AUV80780.1 glucohydrolase [Salinigranum rubrum]
MTERSRHTEIDEEWWKEAVVYQIYPRSFNDSDGDGVGDLPGIVEKVEYLDSLGVDVVWLCPVYDSPNADNGYDIRDYRAIMDEFGTMADWETLLDELHARDIKLVMDLVVNHTSDEHEWFEKSRRQEGKYEDYYIWQAGERDEPPNNWGSFMGGSAWTFDEVRGAWYLHLFDEKQPDLNWRNPAVRADVKELMRWWLEKGIDGFRMDAVNFLSKADGLPDGNPDDWPVGNEHTYHGPRLIEYLRELYDDVLSEYDVMTVAEMDSTPVDLAAEYLGEGGAGLDMIYHFEHMHLDAGPRGRWDPEGWGEWSLVEFKEVMSRWQTGLRGRGWNAVYLGNHDQPRIVSRFGSDEYRAESAKLLATFLLTVGGTPYLYQGDEIGMTNAEFDGLDELDDPMTIGAVEDLIADGEIDSFDEARGMVNYTSRDHARTPMQWDGSPNAGFTDGEPWFAVNDTYPEINVAAALEDEASIWHHYRELIDLRHDNDVFVYGEYDLLLPDDEQVYAYTRSLDDETVLVVLNWSDESTRFSGDAVDDTDATALVGTYPDPPSAPTERAFRPYEAAVYRL